MIVVDASAVLAIYLNEPERGVFLEVLTKAAQLEMTAVNAWEVLARARSVNGVEGAREAEALLAALGITVVSTSLDDVRAAVDAFSLYGRKTSANLNLGDCFAYALAKKRQAPLLFKGDDFDKTDVERAYP
jgi:ribonuclease VapC